jgi:hypothetical protein
MVEERLDLVAHHRGREDDVLPAGQSRADRRVVGDRAVLERDVEVDADEDAPVGDVDVVEGPHEAATEAGRSASTRWTTSTSRLE